jgi:hypothetical protein
MTADRTARECLETVINSVQNWLNRGICQNCALTVASKSLNVDRNTVEKVWVDHQVNLLDAETALD